MKIKLLQVLFFLSVVGLGACSAQGLPTDKPADQYNSPQELIAALEASGAITCRSYEDTTPAGDIGIASGHCVAVLENNVTVPLLVTVFDEAALASGGLETYVNSYQEAARANDGDPILLTGPNWVVSSLRPVLIDVQGLIGGSLQE